MLLNRHDLSYQEIVYRHSRSTKYLAHSEREQSYDWQICPKNTPRIKDPFISRTEPLFGTKMVK